MAVSYVPDAGHIVWLEFDPQVGREQAGRRPAVVLTPASYNKKTSLMICCPLTSQIKGYPFEVLVEIDGTQSVVLSDQVKSLDWKIRKAKFKDKVSLDVLVEVRAKAKSLLSIS
ncbi:endoribonuclease MazF [Polynucleobacter sp. 15G-AUS-farblos]|uniref:endoribonuclease MazF n=1 Tax=Polynucleobacter sp. 15G-AUS-farblos TaxID=2689094 RepID=UPI001C0BD790|nr:endoribonuclease MazF [Polynucleobacter sp. 15G-AUS-farblos]MBU3582456.1 endoribonuclease MazF [Polynucleobacter sp. 15G-AUS-farblos]